MSMRLAMVALKGRINVNKITTSAKSGFGLEREYERAGMGGRGRGECSGEDLPVLHDKVDLIDFKDVKLLQSYVPERGKDFLPRRISGICATHQRMLAEAIKRRAQHRAAAICSGLIFPVALWRGIRGEGL